MPLSTSEIEDQLFSIEKSFFSEPVLIDNVQVWPLIKDFFYFMQFETLRTKKIKNGDIIYRYPKFFHLKKLVWRILYSYYFLLIKVEILFKISKSEFLFLDVTNAEYMSNSKGKFYSRYISPYFSVIKKFGKTSMFKFALLNEVKLPKINSSVESRFILKARKYFFLLNTSKMHSLNSCFIAILNSLGTCNVDEGLSFSYSDYSVNLSKNLLDIQFYRTIAAELLKKTTPKAIFIETYFGHMDYYGSILAARAMKIPVIDIQHGNSSTIMYRGYRNEKNNAISLLPNYYWVWSRLEYDYIAKERDGNAVLKPVLLGKHFYEEDVKSGIDFFNKLNKIKLSYRKIVLVTFQYYYRYYELLKPVILALKDCFFLLRFHPLDFKDPGFREHYIDYFKELMNIEYEQSTSADINMLFNMADLHITWSSASAIDALNFGTKTVLLNKEVAKSHFEMYYNNQVFLTFDSEEELKSQIINSTKLSQIETEYYTQHISDVNIAYRLKELINNGN